MIGDAVSDLHAGKQAGVRTVAVGWGYQSPERLLAHHPDYFASTPEALTAICERLEM